MSEHQPAITAASGRERGSTLSEEVRGQQVVHSVVCLVSKTNASTSDVCLIHTLVYVLFYLMDLADFGQYFIQINVSYGYLCF